MGRRDVVKSWAYWFTISQEFKTLRDMYQRGLMLRSDFERMMRP